MVNAAVSAAAAGILTLMLRQPGTCCSARAHAASRLTTGVARG
jgi:hypothetical protein